MTLITKQQLLDGLLTRIKKKGITTLTSWGVNRLRELVGCSITLVRNRMRVHGVNSSDRQAPILLIVEARKNGMSMAQALRLYGRGMTPAARRHVRLTF